KSQDRQVGVSIDPTGPPKGNEGAAPTKGAGRKGRSSGKATACPRPCVQGCSCWQFASRDILASLTPFMIRARTLRVATVFVCAVALSPAIAPAQRDRIPPRIDTSRRVVLRGTRNPRALPDNDEGPVEPPRRIAGITLHLKSSPQQAAALERLLEEQQ